MKGVSLAKYVRPDTVQSVSYVLQHLGQGSWFQFTALWDTFDLSKGLLNETPKISLSAPSVRYDT